MNMNQIINMVIRIFMRKGIGFVMNGAINFFANRSKKQTIQQDNQINTKIDEEKIRSVQRTKF